MLEQRDAIKRNLSICKGRKKNTVLKLALHSHWLADTTEISSSQNQRALNSAGIKRIVITSNTSITN